MSLLPDSNWRVLTEPDYKSGAINHYAKKALNVFVMAELYFTFNLIAKDICFISYSCMFVVVSLSSQTITGDYT